MKGKEWETVGEKDEERGGGERTWAGKAVMVGKQGSSEKVESGMRERELLEDGGGVRGMGGGEGRMK